MNTQHVLADRYKLRRPIGSGSYADAWLARDIALDRDVAIKLFREHTCEIGDIAPQFQREAQAAASVSHPNVVLTYDAGHDGSQRYLVMEWVDGGTLKDEIRTRGRVQAADAIQISLECLSGLAAIHALGIVHRDVKPQNILVSRDGQVKLTDFGIASAPREATAGQPGTTVGTASYISPEQAQGQNVSPPSDIYSMGIVLYEMLTGQLPFSGTDPLQVIYQHVHETPRRPRRYNPSIPGPLEAVVLQALSKRPEDRFASAQDMQNALREAAFAPGRVPVEEVSGTSILAAAFGGRRSRIAMTTSTAVLAFLMLAASFVLATRELSTSSGEHATNVDQDVSYARTDAAASRNSLIATLERALEAPEESDENGTIADQDESTVTIGSDATQDEQAEEEREMPVVDDSSHDASDSTDTVDHSGNVASDPAEDAGNGDGNNGNGPPGNTGNGNGNSGNGSPGNSGNAGNGNGNGSPGNSGNAGNGNGNASNGSPGNSGNAGNGNGNAGNVSPGNSGNAGS